MSPNILVTNDDGYQAPGLSALAEALGAIGKVTVFAPDHNWSAAGHTKTMHKPLRISKGALSDGTPLYITTGTPSDCVGLALLGAVPEPPDLVAPAYSAGVVSGINDGLNVGHDITYSGTLAAAMEAAVFGLPAIAVSQDNIGESRGDLRFAAGIVSLLAGKALAHGLPPGSFLNVNFPALPPDLVHGIQITRLGRRIYRDVLIKRLDPKGKPYYWIGGDPPGGEPLEGTDIGALAQGYVSVTPLNLDMTDRTLAGVLSQWGLALQGDAPGARR